MSKPRYKTTNWKQYSQTAINRGSLTFWIDEEAIAELKQSKHGKRGRARQFSDIAKTTALIFLYAIESAARVYKLIMSIGWHPASLHTLQLYKSLSLGS